MPLWAILSRLFLKLSSVCIICFFLKKTYLFFINFLTKILLIRKQEEFYILVQRYWYLPSFFDDLLKCIKDFQRYVCKDIVSFSFSSIKKSTIFHTTDANFLFIIHLCDLNLLHDTIYFFLNYKCIQIFETVQSITCILRKVLRACIFARTFLTFNER